MATRTEELNRLTATEAAKAIASGALKPDALAESCLERIAARGELKAWAYVDRDTALKNARICGQGVLRGIPVGVKDVIDTADMPTEYGSVLHKGFRPDQDSACVAATRASGGVILGKTATTEFASPWQMGAKNPHDMTRTPGVSSSGSAAAVADFHVPLAFGTQTGGSTVRPASYCGIWGLKASLDGIDRGGVHHLKKSIDTLGVFARTLDDVNLFMAGLTNKPLGSLDGASKPRNGICRTPEWKDAEPATVEAIDRAKKALEKAGAAVDEVELPRGYDHAMAAFRTITTRENLRMLMDEINRGEDTLNPWIREGIAAARQVGPTDYEMANFGTGFYRQNYAKIFDSHDALLTPSANGEAPKGLEGATLGQFNSFWTWMYGPALNIPAFLGPSKMPVGVTLVGKQGEDAKLLQTARWVEKALGSLPISLA